MSSPAEYPFHRGQSEYSRLASQAEILAPMTRRILQEAGIGRGMRVLDLGCGAGDVSLLLAGLVGSEGSVVGLDTDASALAHAAERAAAGGFSNVSFEHADVVGHAPSAPFDAVAGRLVLAYLPDPVAALAAVIKHVRPGGVVAMMEPWLMPRGGPDSTVQRVFHCMIETMRRAGTRLDMGPRLHRVFTQAGLPMPHMHFEAVIDGRADSPLYRYCVDTLTSLLPKAVEYGIAAADEFDLEVLPGRIREEMAAAGYAMLSLPIVSAWCRVPGPDAGVLAGEAAEAEVLAAEHEFFAALIAGRPERLQQILTEDFTLAALNGALISKGDLMGALGAGQLQFESIDPLEARVRFHGDTAIVTGRTRMSGRLGGEPFTAASRYTHVFVRSQGRQRLAAAQGTPIAP